jgi:hypothetical protein
LGDCPAEGEGCFSLVQPLRFPPMIVAPGRIAVVTEDGLRERSRSMKPTKSARSVGVRRSSPFVIEEITHAGHELVAEGQCPASSRTVSSDVVGLGRLRSGESAVLCLGAGGRSGCVPKPCCVEEGESDATSCIEFVLWFGTVDRVRHLVEWKWHMLVTDPGMAPPIKLRFAELGGHIAVVQTVFVDRHPTDGGWEVVFGPEGVSGKHLDSSSDSSHLISLAVVAGKLEMIFSDRGYSVAPDGTTSMVGYEDLGKFSGRESDYPCVAQAGDGSVTVTMPAQRFDILPDGLRTRSGTATVRYANALLPFGPDALGAGARCPRRSPAMVRIGEEDHAWWLEHPMRATLEGSRGLIVYETPANVRGGSSLRVERRAW